MTPVWLPDSVTTLPERMIDRALLWGLEGLELRTVGGPSERVPNVNESSLRRRLEHSELAVAAIVPGVFEGEAGDRASWMNDLALLDDSLAFCRRFSVGIVVVSAFLPGGSPDTVVDALRRAGDRAARHGRSIAVLNEPGSGCRTGSELGDLVRRTGHPAVGAAWNPACDEDSETGGSAVAGHVLLLRWPAGDGVKPGVLEHLVSGGFDGPVSLVLPEGAGKADGLSAATAMIRVLRDVHSPRAT